VLRARLQVCSFFISGSIWMCKCENHHFKWTKHLYPSFLLIRNLLCELLCRYIVFTSSSFYTI